MKQAASALLMVEPTTFGFNDETADSNFFQKQIKGFSGDEINQLALSEFYNAITILRKEGIKVLIKQNL